MIALGSLFFSAPLTAGAVMPVHQVAPGIYRGRAPATDEDFRRLKDLGVKTVLNLRRRDAGAIAHERARLSAMGIDTVHVPMRYFPGGDGSVDLAVSVVKDTRLHPIYVHCKHGKDRCGVVIGLYRVRHQGWKHEAAYSEMTRHGFDRRLFGLRRTFWRG
ncbi:MAG TPA: tyrosine-protein phosphatase [Pirellulales bacterium]|nr:tyrosine-protein phosphatase [Pirellulales bacterium]